MHASSPVAPATFHALDLAGNVPRPPPDAPAFRRRLLVLILAVAVLLFGLASSVTAQMDDVLQAYVSCTRGVWEDQEGGMPAMVTQYAIWWSADELLPACVDLDLVPGFGSFHPITGDYLYRIGYAEGGNWTIRGCFSACTRWGGNCGGARCM